MEGLEIAKSLGGSVVDGLGLPFKAVLFVLAVVALKYLSKWGAMWWKLSRKALRR